MTDLLRFLFHFCKTLIESSCMDPHNKLFTNCPTHPFSWTYVRLSKTFQCKGNTIINVNLSLSVNSSFLCIGLVFRNSQHFGIMYSLQMHCLCNILVHIGKWSSRIFVNFDTWNLIKRLNYIFSKLFKWKNPFDGKRFFTWIVWEFLNNVVIISKRFYEV